MQNFYGMFALLLIYGSIQIRGDTLTTKYGIEYTGQFIKVDDRTIQYRFGDRGTILDIDPDIVYRIVGTDSTLFECRELQEYRRLHPDVTSREIARFDVDYFANVKKRQKLRVASELVKGGLVSILTQFALYISIGLLLMYLDI